MKIQSGNTGELWRVSYPMMITFFSMMFMVFADRLFLSWYSTSSLNASVKAGTLSWGIILGWMTMAAMSEVFVAQFNGAKKYENIGVPVWQMIWLTLSSYLFYIPFAFLAAPLIYDPLTLPEEFIFFQVLMFFGPIFSLVSAISGFYIGRGQTQIIQWMAIVGNLVNIILDPILIFGVDGIIPEMGIKGAAIATGIGTFVQFLVLFLIFLKRSFRQQFNTHKLKFNYEIFSKTVRVGLPPSLFVGLELIGWAIFFQGMSLIGPVHMFVVSVCQSIVLLFLFFGMGVEKGAIALTGNFIGAGKQRMIGNVFRSGLVLISLFTLFSAIFLIIYPNPLIDWFFRNTTTFEEVIGFDASIDEVKFLIRIGLIFSFFYIMFENIRWAINGMLTAAGDTIYLLVSGMLSVWFGLLLPTYLFVVLPKNHLFYAFVIWVMYAIISMGVVYYRFQSGKWKKHSLLIEEPTTTPEIKEPIRVRETEEL